jgi:ketosteroid isomerase-like protein
MTENNKMLLMKANEAVSKGDYEGFLEYCTEDTKWIFVGDQGSGRKRRSTKMDVN